MDSTVTNPESEQSEPGQEPDPAAAHSTAATILPMLPVTTGIVLPDMVVTIRVESDEARTALDAAGEREVALVPRLGSHYASVGVVVRVEQRGTLPDGSDAVVVRGLRRVKIGAGVVTDTPALWVEVEAAAETEPEGHVAVELAAELAAEYRRVATELLSQVGGRRFAGALDDLDTPGALADSIGWWPALSFERRVALVETLDVAERLRLAIAWATDALNEAKVIGGINEQVSGEFSKAQRDAILRKQMDAIRAELGEGSDDVVDDFRARLADLDVVDAVRVAIGKEIDRLERVGEQSMESSWIRTWLDTVFDLPWSVRTADNLDLAHARAVLDADHTGLDDVKARMVEFLAVRARRAQRGTDTTGRRTGTILVLVGPPGVGKTSLGESVARALGRKFVRTALGGIHDEAEIRGHRRTYVGARPGRIARALIDAGSMNPVLLLDEIDKVGTDWRGDPTSALLEVLDPAQNHTFRDHYLELELDLSDVVFVATANTLDRLPAPLLDRMEVITIAGYSDDEKLAIARDHLVPRVFDRNAVDAGEVELPDETVHAVIDRYTREAGVRRLEQRLDRLVRKAATTLETEPDGPRPLRIGVESLRDALGRAMPDDRPADRVDRPGIATGLAVTGAGGDVLFVEALAMPGEAGLTLTGQLGDVMRESGEIALSYLRAHASDLGVHPDEMQRRFHVHFPAGAVPKDGPSAGVTMTTALASLLTGRAVDASVGMTGEVTLQGRVLPIGGVKEKVLAAHRSGLRTVILPADNELDADDIPDAVRNDLTLHFVRDVSEVLQLALS